MPRAPAQVSAYGPTDKVNKMTTDSFLQVLTIYLAWALRTSETLSNRAPARVSARV